ncbi:MAG: hypothetical protein DRQ60_11045 [Gammaproteobacteria bacterium]|nr:MAG: hypothetical protein DRQ54_02170 [Gammaproteobacteria bacterium]RLA10565.1 MAG: hypothetical protein DRQ60_11045 [Gammaproteobacteria bacterium]RLA15143.1 MAG: hypothetical protein DRQ52_02550 [Gammaproteobacteria bacterium]
MSTTSHDWLVLLRVRFPHILDAAEQSFEAPPRADVWRFGPENSSFNDLGLPNFRSETWGGFALYHDRETAEAVVAAPRDSLPFLTDAVEAWCGLLLPVTHRGEVDLRGQVESDSAIQTVDQDPGGPLVVVTTAGYLSREPDQIPRIVDFNARASKARDFYKTLEGNVRSSIFYTGHDGLDNLTCSFWRNDAAMQEAAYDAGYHRDQIKRQNTHQMTDRTSFTRARVLESSGTWDGSNPVDEMS